MNNSPNAFLIAGAALSAVAAAAHVGCIVFGASWYRFFGAGERMAKMAAAGNWRAAAVTALIAAVLATWAVYALSGAGLIPRLPLLRLALCFITGIYLLRGIAGVPLAIFSTDRSMAFWWWSSAICFAIGAIHFAGLRQVWASL
jgi:hypothetical protein